MQTDFLKSVSRALVLVFMVLMPVVVVAQATPSASGTTNSNPSRWDIFVGYSYLSPHGNVSTLVPNGSTITVSYDAVNVGGVASATYFTNRYVGLQGEVGVHEWGGQVPGSNVGSEGNDDGFTTLAGGLVFRYPKGNLTPFAHALAEAALVGGPFYEPNTWGPGVTA